MRSVLFANHGIGDVVMGLPLLRALIREFDDECLVVTKSETESHLVELAVGSNSRARLLNLASLGGGPGRRSIALARRVRRHHPDVSAMIFGVHPLKAGLIGLLSGAQERAGPEAGRGSAMFNVKLPVLDPTTTTTHKVEYACEVATRLGRTCEPDIRIDVADQAIDRVASQLEPGDGSPMILVALGSGAVESHKRLPVGRARRLTRRLTSVGRVVLVGAAPEAEYNRTIRDASPLVCDLTGRTTIEDVLALAAMSDVVIATCNGVSHLAAAAGAKIVGLFGPTNPQHTGPYSDSLRVVTLRLDCSPCYRRGFIRGCGNPICMDLEVMEIMRAVEDQMNSVYR